MQSPKKRVLFYAQDGIGLGHLRRLCRLAEGLDDTYAVLIVSAKPEVAWMTPKKCEFVHLPRWGGFGLGVHAATHIPWLPVSKDVAVGMVQSMLEGVVHAFDPDYIIVDHTLVGMFGEVRRILKETRAYTCVTWRGVLDDNDARWFSSLAVDMHDSIDAFLVACDERMSDFRPDSSRLPAFSSKTHHIGYVMPVAVEREVVRERHGIPPTARWVVCSAGGGKQAEIFFDACAMVATKFPDVFFDVVRGPYAETHSGDLLSERIRIRDQVHDLSDMHAACDVAIINGGYNSLLEAAHGGGRILVWPNQSNPEGEQVSHTARLSRHYPIVRISDISEFESRIDDALKEVSEESRPQFTLDSDGVRQFREFLKNTLV